VAVVRFGSWHCAQGALELLDWVHGVVVSAQGVTGVYRPTVDSLEVRSEAIPLWVIIVAVVFFPVGLLALLVKEHMVMLIRVPPNLSGGCDIFISGSGSNQLIEAVTYIYNQTKVPDPSSL